MAWDRIHRSVNGNGGVSMTPGYYSETITLGNDADASTSILDTPIKSDTTILVKFNRDVTTDTYVQIEHSWDGTTWVKEGNFEEDASVDHDDLSKDMSKIAGLDASVIGNMSDGVMMLYDIDSHGAANYTRFTVKANGTDESNTECQFHFIPHF